MPGAQRRSNPALLCGCGLLRLARNDDAVPSHLLERHIDLAALLEPLRHRQVLGAHEIRIEQFGLIAVSGIAEHGHDGMTRSYLAGEPDRACDIDAGRAAETKTFVLEQPVNHWHGLLVRNEIGLIDLGILDDRRDAA